MKLLVLTPSRGQVSCGHRDMFKDLALLCAEREIAFDVGDQFLAQEIHQARNLLLYEAMLLADEDWAVWIDSDVSLNPRLIIDNLHRPEELIARVYPIKPYGNETPGWSAAPVRNRKNEGEWSEDKTMLKGIYSGLGCMLMKPVVAKKLAEKVGVKGLGNPRGVGRHIPAFDHRYNEWDIRLGEDVSFCDRWLELGGDLWLAPDGHVQNASWSGVFLDQLVKTMPMPEGIENG